MTPSVAGAASSRPTAAVDPTGGDCRRRQRRYLARVARLVVASATALLLGAPSSATIVVYVLHPDWAVVAADRFACCSVDLPEDGAPAEPRRRLVNYPYKVFRFDAPSSDERERGRALLVAWGAGQVDDGYVVFRFIEGFLHPGGPVAGFLPCDPGSFTGEDVRANAKRLQQGLASCWSAEIALGGGAPEPPPILLDLVTVGEQGPLVERYRVLPPAGRGRERSVEGEEEPPAADLSRTPEPQILVRLEPDVSSPEALARHQAIYVGGWSHMVFRALFGVDRLMHPEQKLREHASAQGLDAKASRRLLRELRRLTRAVKKERKCSRIQGRAVRDRLAYLEFEEIQLCEAEKLACELVDFQMHMLELPGDKRLGHLLGERFGGHVDWPGGHRLQLARLQADGQYDILRCPEDGCPCQPLSPQLGTTLQAGPPSPERPAPDARAGREPAPHPPTADVTETGTPPRH